MDSLIDSTVINAILAIITGFAIFYFFFVKNESTQEAENDKPTQPTEIKSRSIKSTTDRTIPVIKKTEAKSQVSREIKKADTSVVKVAQTSHLSLSTYEATTAMSIMVAQTYIKNLYRVNEKSFFEEFATDVKADKDTTKSRNVIVKPSLESTRVIGNMDKDFGSKLKCDKAVALRPDRPSLAAFNATLSCLALQSRKYIESLPKPPRPCLAAFNATEASLVLQHRKYIKSLPAPPRPHLAAFNATEASLILQHRKYIKSLPKAPRPHLAAYNATEASLVLQHRKYIKSLPAPPRPHLAAFNATEASLALQHRKYIKSLPKAPRPHLAAYNATEASLALQHRKYIKSLPAPPRPHLAAFNATEASLILQHRKYIKSLPKAPRPHLAAYNATEASLVLQHRKYIKSLPAPPRPHLAAFNATEASLALQHRKYIKSLPKAPRPCLADYNSTEALNIIIARQYIDSLPKQPVPFLSQYNATEAMIALKSQKFIASIRCAKVKDIQRESDKVKSNLVRVEATNASLLLKYQVYVQKHQHYVSDSEVGTDGPLSSPSTTPSTSTSSLHSEKNRITAVLNKQQDIDSQVYGAAWGPPIFGGNMMTGEPLRLNGTFNLNEKKEWSIEEKIGKQTQSHMPKMKNRCDYWPNCTNKHCKFSHPTSPCRVGDDCPFGNRCSFIHPKDLVNPPKKHSSSTGIPKRNPSTGSSSRRHTASGIPTGANSYRANSNRSSFILLN
ncbi:hypothetical protein EDC94DRAFT_656770 [Helicostylum pulchrum]|nr:hypothetical protein EDC94DRAFT_656770 [Helicostylum pulchrum]